MSFHPWSGKKLFYFLVFLFRQTSCLPVHTRSSAKEPRFFCGGPSSLADKTHFPSPWREYRGPEVKVLLRRTECGGREDLYNILLVFYFLSEYFAKNVWRSQLAREVRNPFPDRYNTCNISHNRSGTFSQKHVPMLKGYFGMW